MPLTTTGISVKIRTKYTQNESSAIPPSPVGQYTACVCRQHKANSLFRAHTDIQLQNAENRWVGGLQTTRVVFTCWQRGRKILHVYAKQVWQYIHGTKIVERRPLPLHSFETRVQEPLPICQRITMPSRSWQSSPCDKTACRTAQRYVSRDLDQQRYRCEYLKCRTVESYSNSFSQPRIKHLTGTAIHQQQCLRH